MLSICALLALFYRPLTPTVVTVEGKKKAHQKSALTGETKSRPNLLDDIEIKNMFLEDYDILPSEEDLGKLTTTVPLNRIKTLSRMNKYLY